jgi:hypothetical protein
MKPLSEVPLLPSPLPHATTLPSLGMLLNQESMHLERIHVMLKMLSTGATDGRGRFDMNLVQLKKYLQSLVHQDVLELVEGGSYRLRKSHRGM